MYPHLIDTKQHKKTIILLYSGSSHSRKTHLVSVGVSADDDGLGPAGHQAGDVLTDDGLSEHRAPQDVTDGAVGRAPHLLELELLHPVLVWRDGGTLDAHVVALHGLGSVHRHLVVRGVAVLHAEVIALRRTQREH